MIGSSDARRAALYRSLQALESSGIPIRDALERVSDPVLAPARELIDQGKSIGDAFAGSPAITKLEARLVRAGETGGRLPEVFGTLSRLYEERTKMKRRLAADLAYPFMLVHLAVLLPNLSALVASGVGAYAVKVLPPLLVLWGIGVGLVMLSRFVRASAPATLDHLVAALPIVGSLARARSQVAALTAMSAVYEAGVPILAAVEAGAEAAPNTLVQDAFHAVAERIQAGAPLGEAFASVSAIPLVIVDAVKTGEKSGKLDVLLEGARKMIEQEADHKRDVVMRVVPVLIYLCVAAYVGYIVITFYVGNINKALEIR